MSLNQWKSGIFEKIFFPIFMRSQITVGIQGVVFLSESSFNFREIRSLSTFPINNQIDSNIEKGISRYDDRS